MRHLLSSYPILSNSSGFRIGTQTNAGSIIIRSLPHQIIRTLSDKPMQWLIWMIVLPDRISDISRSSNPSQLSRSRIARLNNWWAGQSCHPYRNVPHPHPQSLIHSLTLSLSSCMVLYCLVLVCLDLIRVDSTWLESRKRYWNWNEDTTRSIILRLTSLIGSDEMLHLMNSLNLMTWREVIIQWWYRYPCSTRLVLYKHVLTWWDYLRRNGRRLSIEQMWRTDGRVKSKQRWIIVRYPPTNTYTYIYVIPVISHWPMNISHLSTVFFHPTSLNIWSTPSLMTSWLDPCPVIQ